MALGDGEGQVQPGGEEPGEQEHGEGPEGEGEQQGQKAQQGDGLVDQLGTLDEVLHQRYGDDVEIERIARRRGLLGGRLSFGGGASAALASGLVSAVEDRSLWARYGL